MDEKNTEFHSVGMCIEDFLLYISSINCYSKNTVDGYRADFNHYAGFIDLEADIRDVSLSALRSVVGSLSKKKYAVTSINRFISSTRKLFSFCKKNKYIDEDVAVGLKTLKKPRLLPKFMTQAEIDTICQEPEKKDLLWPSRDKAIFEVLYSSGCRVSELVSLTFSACSKGMDSALVTGKGQKQRRVFFAEDAQKALKDYIVERNDRFPEHSRKGASPIDFIFLNMKGKALTVNGVEYIVRNYTGPKGTNNPVTPHAFRHTFATAVLSGGADIRDVQAMLGHSNISTTQIYTHVTTKQLVDAYNQAFPHSGKKD